MHEASLIAGLMRRINEVALAGGARRVVSVSVRLGALSHMSAAHLAEHFARAAAGTIAADARLDVEADQDPHDPRAETIVLKGIEIES